MDENSIDRKGLSGGRGFLGRLGRPFVVFLLGGLVFLIVAALWIVPGVIRLELEQRLSELCDGPVEIRDVETNLDGRIRIEGVELFEETERPWLSVEDIEVKLKRWPGFNPSVGTVSIDGLNFRLSIVDDKLLLPRINWAELGDTRNRDSSLEKLSIKQAAIIVVDDEGKEAVYDGMTMTVSAKADGDYEFELNRNTGEDSEELSAKGVVKMPGGEFNISLQVGHRFAKTEIAAVCAALRMAGVSGEGRFTANLKATGSVEKPFGLQSNGSVELSDCVVFFEERVLADDLGVTARLDGQRLDFNECTAIMGGGQVNGTFYAEIRENRFIEYQGGVWTTDVNYAEVASVFRGEPNGTGKGSLAGNYSFSGRHDDPNGIQGEGFVFLDDADVSILPIIPVLFKFVGLSRLEPLKTSDAEAQFSSTGAIVTIESGHVANRFAAVEFEPGGTVDLDAGQVDGYVVAAPLSNITGFIEKLPIINILSRLKDKLIRLRVKGHWSDPPGKLIKKEPIEDIKEGTVGFIKDVAEAGGQLGKGMIDGFAELLKKKQNGSK